MLSSQRAKESDERSQGGVARSSKRLRLDIVGRFAVRLRSNDDGTEDDVGEATRMMAALQLATNGRKDVWSVRVVKRLLMVCW